MKAARMNRLFAPSGNCFDVAIDHGMFNEGSFLGGIEDMGSAIRTIAAAKPDAIQLPPGTAQLLQAIPGKDNGFDMEGLAVDGDRLLLGLRGPVLRGFSEALLIGILAGTYSSIYISASVALDCGLKAEHIFPVIDPKKSADSLP